MCASLHATTLDTLLVHGVCTNDNQNMIDVPTRWIEMLQLLANGNGDTRVSPHHTTLAHSRTRLTWAARDLKSLTCSGTNKNGFGPKVLVEVRLVSLLGGWKTEEGPMSASRETPKREGGREGGGRERKEEGGRGGGRVRLTQGMGSETLRFGNEGGGARDSMLTTRSLPPPMQTMIIHQFQGEKSSVFEGKS